MLSILLMWRWEREKVSYPMKLHWDDYLVLSLGNGVMNLVPFEPMLVWNFFEQLHGIFFSTIVCEFMKGSSPTPCVATSSWGCIHDRFIDTQFVLPVHFISGCGADFLRVLLSNPRFTLSYRAGGWLRVLLIAGGTTHPDSVVELHAFVYVIWRR